MKLMEMNASGITAYHATKEDFDQFDIKFANDDIGMKMNEGLGYKKFYFSKQRKDAFPKVRSIHDKRPTILLTVKLDVKQSYCGVLYLQELNELMNKGMSRKQAVDKLDVKLKALGYDAIEDSWQIAVFNPSQIKIVNKEIF